MIKNFIDRMRTALLVQKRQIFNTFVDENAELHAIVDETNVKDIGDKANDVADQQTIEALGTKELNQVMAINAALLRIQEGVYGSCAKCSKKIPEERLEAIPSAIYCIDCQKRGERRKR